MSLGKCYNCDNRADKHGKTGDFCHLIRTTELISETAFNSFFSLFNQNLSAEVIDFLSVVDWILCRKN